MSFRKQITALFITVLALATVSTVASAQTTGGGSSGSTRCVVVASDLDVTPGASLFDFEFVSNARISLFSLFSWGRGPVNRPGTLRSSTAVLRERRGLMR